MRTQHPHISGTKTPWTHKHSEPSRSTCQHVTPPCDSLPHLASLVAAAGAAGQPCQVAQASHTKPVASSSSPLMASQQRAECRHSQASASNGNCVAISCSKGVAPGTAGVPTASLAIPGKRKLEKLRWTMSESEALKVAIDAHGLDAWTAVAACVGTRSVKQCREHYVQVLRYVSSSPLQGLSHWEALPHA